MFDYLPAVNATLNAAATVLLVVGWGLIKARREAAHKCVMLTAFGVSTLFLICYLIHHVHIGGSVPFAGPPKVRTVYLVILATHVVLAATVPFLAIVTIVRGIRQEREKHRRVARWTWPIWLYVSVTGIVVYVMLYQLFPAGGKHPIISQGSAQADAERQEENR